MAIDTRGTWDLSPNDQLALRHILKLVDALAAKVAFAFGGTPQSQITKCCNAVERHHEALR